LFSFINANGDGYISAGELFAFLEDNYVYEPMLKECVSIISEFDSSQDGTMEYDEFLNMVMPATNRQLREYCLYRKIPYSDPNKPLNINV